MSIRRSLSCDDLVNWSPLCHLLTTHMLDWHISLQHIVVSSISSSSVFVVNLHVVPSLPRCLPWPPSTNCTLPRRTRLSSPLVSSDAHSSLVAALHSARHTTAPPTARSFSHSSPTRIYSMMVLLAHPYFYSRWPGRASPCPKLPGDSLGPRTLPLRQR